MKPKTLIVLVVLILACTAYVVIRHTDLFKGKPQPTAQPAVTLFTPEPKAIEKITIAPADARPLTLEMQNGKWRIIDPIDAKADDAAVNRLAGKLLSLKASRSFKPVAGSPDDATDDVSGLDKPSSLILFTDAARMTYQLTLGKAVPFTKDTYARPSGSDKTFVMENVSPSDFDASPAIYRDKTVLAIPSAEVVRLAVQGKANFELAKQDDQWVITKPRSAAADQAKVTGLLSELGRVTATHFVSDKPANLASYGLEPGKERGVVRIILADKSAAPAKTPATATSPTTASAPAPAAAAEKEIVLALGNSTDSGVFAKLGDAPAVFMLPVATADALQPKLSELRGKKLMNFDVGSAAGIDITTPSGTLKLGRGGQVDKMMGDIVAKVTGGAPDMTWRMVKPVAGKANEAKVSDLLVAMSSLQADQLPDANPISAGLDAPQATFTISMSPASHKKDVRLIVGAATGSGEFTYVADSSEGAVALVKTESIKPLIAEPAGYYDATLLTTPAGQEVQELSIKRKDGAWELSRGSDRAWQITAPKASKADPATLQLLTTQLSGLSGNTIVSLGSQVPAKYASAPDAIRVLVRYTKAQPARPVTTTPTSGPTSKPAITDQKTLHLVKLDGKAYAWVDGAVNNPVAELPAGVFDSFNGELRNRQVWDLKGQDITSIKGSGAENYELRKEQGKWVLASDKFVAIDSVKVEAYIADAQALAADKFLTRTAGTGSYDFKEATVLELTGAKGSWKLSLSKPAANAPAGSPRICTATGVDGVFELSPTTVSRIIKPWKDFQATKPEPTPPGGPGEMPNFPGGMPPE